MNIKNILLPTSMLSSSTLLASKQYYQRLITPLQKSRSHRRMAEKYLMDQPGAQKKWMAFPGYYFMLTLMKAILNEELTENLKKKESIPSYMESVAVINLAATWKPNSIIGLILASKQKEFPDTSTLKMKNSVLVKKWKLKDDDYVVIYFDKTGKVLFRKEGKFSKKEIDDLLKVMKDNAPKDAKPIFPNKK